MTTSLSLHLTTIAFLIVAVASQTQPTTYTNHTVGDSAGWHFNSSTKTSSANYTSWAARQSFSLGDFLIFNTNSNQSVVLTYNLTTFRSCSFDDASDNYTFLYNGGATAFGEALTIPVPLTIEGPNYFFSDADDGVPCRNGMAFEIRVNHGLGLPPSLNQPPPPPYIAPPGPNSAQSPPITIQGGSTAPGDNGIRESASLRVIGSAILLTVAGIILS